jgi:hypothetical protein
LWTLSTIDIGRMLIKTTGFQKVNSVTCFGSY